jgi:hypothetical protein
MIRTQNKYYWCDYITEEMHGTYSTYWRQGKPEHNWVHIIEMDLTETG